MVNTAEPGNRHACAACKHQRKKCKKDCVLALYFPANRSEEFQSIHKIFGVSNLSKILRSIQDEGDRKEAVKSIIWEAKMWVEDPVHGPLGTYTMLTRELELLKNRQNQRIAPQSISPYGTDLGLKEISTPERRESIIIPNNDAVIATMYYSNTNQNTFMHREGQALDCIAPPPSSPYVTMAAEGQERVSQESGIVIDEPPVALAEPPGRRQIVGLGSSVVVPMEQQGIRAKGQASDCIAPPPCSPYVTVAAEGQERVSRGSGIVSAEQPIALAEPRGRRQIVGCGSSIVVPMEEQGKRASQGSDYATPYNTVYNQQQVINYQGNYNGIINNTISSYWQGQEEEAQRGGVYSHPASYAATPPLVEGAGQVRSYSPYPYNTIIQKPGTGRNYDGPTYPYNTITQKPEIDRNYDGLVAQHQQHVYPERNIHQSHTFNLIEIIK